MDVTARAAFEYNKLGLAAIPVKKDKLPVYTWDQFKNVAPTEEETRRQFGNGHHGVALIGGKASGGLEIIDIDTKYDLSGNLAAEFLSLLESHLPDVFGSLPIERTPSGGLHIYYRCSNPGGNQKLALRPVTAEELSEKPTRKPPAVIETRGQGGYAIAYPTPGYNLLQGDLMGIPYISDEQRNVIIGLARSFDEMPVVQATTVPTQTRHISSLTPWEDFNERGDAISIIERNGFRRISQKGDRIIYQWQDSKNPSSANYHLGKRTLYVFSTSTPFDSDKAYSPSAIHAILEHNGDFTASAKALSEAGYGEALPSKRYEPATTLNSLISLNSKDERRKPELSNDALYGVFGDAVKKIEPYSEASVPAMLVQLLSAFGVMIDRKAFFSFGRDRHYLKLNSVLVGPSGKGRKGTSWGEVHSLLSRVDEGFPKLVISGLSSGEGLISHVRDPFFKKTPIKEKGRIVEYQDELIDEGAIEKRLFIQESEFSRVIKVAGREGSTLSEILRDVFDKDNLRVMTKNSLVASDVHIAFCGHITEFELAREMDDVSKANGFGNRIMWIYTERSKALPFGGEMPEGELNREVQLLREAANLGGVLKEMKRTADADQLWAEVYEPLTEGYSGMMEALTARATAHVMRMACIFAIGDQQRVIDYQHLNAALAVWQFAEDSARYIFGNSFGDKHADLILGALRENPDGLTRTEISTLLGKHVKSEVISGTLDRLEGLRRIQSRKIKTAGAPITKYFISGISELSEISH